MSNVNVFDTTVFHFLHSPDCAMSIYAQISLFMSNHSMYLWTLIALIYVLLGGKNKYFILFMCVGGFFTIWQINDELIKPLFERIRPPYELGTCVIGEIPKSYSFPSGHTLTAWAFATILYLYSSRSWLPFVLCYGFALYQGYLRIFLGVHYPTDVIGGAIMGIAMGYAWYRAVEFSREHYRRI